MNTPGIALSILSAATLVACSSREDLVAPAESETESIQQTLVSPPEGDAVTDWNAIVMDAVIAGRPGPTGVVDLALVQAAVHDAVQAIDRRYEPYFAEVPGARGSPDTTGDDTWQPLINTPNYPDYTSGANNITGAVTRTLALFFQRDDLTFTVTSNAPLAVQKTRTFDRFSEAAREVVDARVFLGIHFRFADTAARVQGQRIAEWAFNHFLLPINRGHHRGDPHGDQGKED